MPFKPEEIQNMRDMLMKSIEDLHKEKSNAGVKWKEILKNLNVTVNFEIMGPDFKESAGFINANFQEGNLSIKEGKSSKALIEFKAPLMNFFQYSSNEISLLGALFGKLKIKGKRHLLTLMKVANLLRVIPEDKLMKQ
ncbi:MAG: hypothetical protein EAX96_17375 [Candidatus Lokiarchaeota archaeon]|nr:hypothetical protein [Candidatus Lokiarchaeota archaeon]